MSGISQYFYFFPVMFCLQLCHLIPQFFSQLAEFLACLLGFFAMIKLSGDCFPFCRRMFRKIISSVGEMGELESLSKNLVCSSADLMWIEAWHSLIQYHSFHLASYLILFGGSESC